MMVKLSASYTDSECHNTYRHRRMDSQTDDKIMPIRMFSLWPWTNSSTCASRV